MTKATFVIFFCQSYQVLLTCYYTQVSYTGSWEPLVYSKYVNGLCNVWSGSG